ncbi:hypothetical protein [Flammeovirga sp. EKP202]|uniref:HD domain-containing protein n=1 Tax=Flammeovirga sp. EKP202 TaxID=2770592 RepID=UPI00165F90F0|nr:hypothetical protein [Flammeovirga sp. EKP202]MBD0400476.1 hypothetical protein [Flammeovirga sp. EKP202]
MLKEKYTSLLSHYTDDLRLIEQYWNEITNHYSSKERKYHNLNHLEHMIVELDDVESKVEDLNPFLFALFYHDLVYNPLKGNNESKSAEIAVKKLSNIGVNSDTISKCKNHILATKQHLLSEVADTNLFIDIDISILGQKWEVYATYFQNVRSEYAIYPDFIYNNGRKKVLKHFLEGDIFLTSHFQKKYEQQARDNINREIQILKS